MGAAFATSQMTQERLNALSANPSDLFLNKHYNKRLQNYDIRLGTNGGDEWSWHRGALRLFYNSDQTDYNPVPSGVGNNGNLYRMDHFIPDNDAVSSWKMNADYYGYDALNRLQVVQENQVNNGAETEAYKQTNTFDRWGNRTIDQNNTWSKDGSVWVEDAAPMGAVAVGDADGWNWVTTSPTPFSGSSSHASTTAAGVHQHYFYGATNTLTPATGESLYAWVYLDPTSPPTEVMLQWNNGSWEHRAYWGADQIGWGTNNTDSRRYMGVLPATGGWVRLEVPAASVGLVGQTINGMAFSLFGGKATWDRAGKTAVTGGGINKEKYTVDATNNRFTELVYDAAGNVTKDKVIGTGRMEYKYDAENHVIAAGNNFVTNNTAPTSQYFYDANGKRTRKLVSGVETWFVYGLDGELVAEYNANAAVASPQKEYGYRSGQLLVVYDSTETADKKLQWMVADHLGTPRMVIDKTGSLSGMKRHDYLPFGEEIGANVGIRSAGNGYTADQIKQKFTGHQRDVETSLDFMQARYFSNTQGRFTSPDLPFADQNPLEPQSMNLYSYGANNPLRYTDPTGRGKVSDFFEKIKNGFVIGETITNAERKEQSVWKRQALQDWLCGGGEGVTRAFGGKNGDPAKMTDAEVWKHHKEISDGNFTVTIVPEVQIELPAPGFGKKGSDPYSPEEVEKRIADNAPRRMAEPRKQASEEGAKLVKQFKDTGLGQAAGRSSGHGTPYQRAGAELVRRANEIRNNPELQQALKIEGERLIQKAGGINH